MKDEEIRNRSEVQLGEEEEAAVVQDGLVMASTWQSDNLSA